MLYLGMGVEELARIIQKSFERRYGRKIALSTWKNQGKEELTRAHIALLHGSTPRLFKRLAIPEEKTKKTQPTKPNPKNRHDPEDEKKDQVHWWVNY